MIEQKAKELGFLLGTTVSPEDVDVAEKAYEQKMCDLGNLMIVAFRKAQDPNSEPFVVTVEHSRKETFKKLGLEEIE